MLIGVLIMGVLVIAAAVLLFTAPRPNDEDQGIASASTPPPSMNLPDENDVTSIPGASTVPPTETPEISESPTLPPQEVRSVTIVYGSQNRVMKDFTSKVGDKTHLRVRIDPLGITEEVIWSSSNTGVFEVVPTNTEKTNATVTGVGKGTATLTVSVGGETAECIVRIK